MILINSIGIPISPYPFLLKVSLPISSLVCLSFDKLKREFLVMRPLHQDMTLVCESRDVLRDFSFVAYFLP